MSLKIARVGVFIGAILCALVIIFVTNAMATTYYVDSVNSFAFDTNNGTSTNTPWKTIAKVNSSSFVAGDNILFIKGGTWRETLTTPSAGSSVSSITIDSYGTGTVMPIINGSDLMTGFTQTTGNVWQKTSMTTQPYIVFFNGVKGTKKASFAAIANPLDWYWASNTLYVYSANDPATLYTNPGVEAGQRTYCINNSNKGYISVKNLHLIGSNGSGINGSGTNAVIQGNTIEYLGGASGANGITSSSANAYIALNTIRTIEGNGIQANFNNGIIESNTINNSWNLVDYPSGVGAGISVVAFTGTVTGNIVRYNSVTNCYQGITTTYAVSSSVYNNLVLLSLVNGISNYNGTAGSPNLFYNNTIWHRPSYTSGHGLVTQTSSDGFHAYNNIVYTDYAGTNVNIQAVCVDSTSYTDISIDNNLYYVASGSTSYLGKLGTNNYTSFSSWKTAIGATSYVGKDVHTVSADPLFRNPSASDYHLNYGSPARGTGKNVGLTSDYYGTYIPASEDPDIGAIQNMNGFVYKTSVYGRGQLNTNVYGRGVGLSGSNVVRP